ncbi:uncharacterized protein mip130 [Drosophila bipectinata]|uniref:uncharacterized protein mip130 n=1 Tax=Drosophila bipectinata TaxID=42026 RepID=UPI001C8ADFF4|nr:uncharacterized protein LOC108133476 [Drosophila bipectinata]
MPVAEVKKSGRGRKPANSVTASTSAAAAWRQKEAASAIAAAAFATLSEEEDIGAVTVGKGRVRPMVQDDDNEHEEPDNDIEDEGIVEEDDLGDEEEEEEEPDSNETSDLEEQIEPPAFSLATLGLQRVGTAPPPKPKVQKAPILTLNARGMPARIRKRNRLFYDENIINDDKPLRMSLAPKRMPGRPPLSAGGGSVHKAPLTPSKVLKKRKGVVSRYMRSSDQGDTNTLFKEQQIKGKKTPGKQGSAGKYLSSGKASGQGGHKGRGNPGKGTAAAAAAMAAAEEAATQAEAQALANKRLGQSIGLRLRNLLKLPKAHKWAIAEWFYSYIDKPLFDCRDEFMNHVNELAPRLGTRKLNRHEWVSIRRRMGRPRRCSANFFNEERRELDRKRQLIRTLQSRKPGEFKDSMLLSDMPDKIPMPLPLGTKVTARLRTPQDGIFAGTVAAYDSLNATYRVTFERPGLGTHAIPDYEIVSENFHEMLPLHSFTKDFRPNLMSIYQTTNLGYPSHLASPYMVKKEKGQQALLGGGSGQAGGNGYASPHKLASSNAAARNALSMKLNKSDPLLGQDSISESPIRQQLARYHHNYSSQLLEHLVHLEKHIQVKAERIQRLNKMNATAELAMGEMMSQDENGDRHRRQIADNFQRQYAFNIVSIERINAELMFELTKVQELSSSLTRNPNVQAMISPTYLREECRAKAAYTVDDMNKGMVKNPRMIALLKNLTTLLIVTQSLGGDCDAAEVNKVLEGCIEEVRSNLVTLENTDVFQKSVQMRLEFIAMDVTRSLAEQTMTRLQEEVEAEEAGETADGEKSPKSPKYEDEAQDGGSPKTPARKTKGKDLKGQKSPKMARLQKLLLSPEEDVDEKKEASPKSSKPAVASTPVKNQAMDTEDEEKLDEEKLEEEKLDDDKSQGMEDLQELHDLQEHIEEEIEDTEEHHLDPEEEARSPNQATDDTQITIESMKESDEEFHTEEEDEEEMIGLEQLKTDDEDMEEEFLYEKKSSEGTVS